MYTLPIPVLLIISVISAFATSMLRGVYSKKYFIGNDELWFFNLVQNIFCLIALIVIFWSSGKLGNFSIYSVMLGVMLAIVNVFGLHANLKAFSIGPFSYTTIIISMSTIIPTLSGYFFGEKITLIQWIGIGLMVICIIISPDYSKKSSHRKLNFKWMILCLTAMMLSGSTGVLQKIHQSSNYKKEMAAFLISSFLASAFISVIMYIKEKTHLKKSNSPIKTMNNIEMWLLPIISGILFSLPHSLNLFLVGVLPSAIMFPIVNLCPMILSMITGIIVFHERFSKIRWLGLLTGITSMVFVSGNI